jgi:hypothetical protein
MTETNAIYQKSAKGSQAIVSRDHALAPKLRSLLILVDGKRPIDELAKLASGLGDTGQLLSQLLQQGYIEESANTAPAPLAASSAPAPLSPARRPMTLQEAQRFAVRRLTDIMGPMSETLCLRIEATRNPQDFMQAIRTAEKVLRDFGGSDLASNFMQEVQAHQPA